MGGSGRAVGAVINYLKILLRYIEILIRNIPFFFIIYFHAFFQNISRQTFQVLANLNYVIIWLLNYTNDFNEKVYIIGKGLWQFRWLQSCYLEAEIMSKRVWLKKLWINCQKFPARWRSGHLIYQRLNGLKGLLFLLLLWINMYLLFTLKDEPLVLVAAGRADLCFCPSSPSCHSPSVEWSWPTLCPFWLNGAAVSLKSPSPPLDRLLALNTEMDLSIST